MCDCIVKNKEFEFSEWYKDVIVKCDLIDYYSISGCYIIKPYAYSIWENIQKFMDDEFRKRGVKNAYFPLLVRKSVLDLE